MTDHILYKPASAVSLSARRKAAMLASMLARAEERRGEAGRLLDDALGLRSPRLSQLAAAEFRAADRLEEVLDRLTYLQGEIAAHEVALALLRAELLANEPEAAALEGVASAAEHEHEAERRKVEASVGPLRERLAERAREADKISYRLSQHLARHPGSDVPEPSSDLDSARAQGPAAAGGEAAP